MKLSDLVTNKDYTIKGLECSLVVKEPILENQGKIALSESGVLCYETSKKMYKFIVRDEYKRLDVFGRFKQGCSNIANMIATTNDNATFFLNIVFFPRSINFHNLEIVVDEKIKKTLVRRKLIWEDEDYLSQFPRQFMLWDGSGKCFAFGKGYEPDEPDSRYSKKVSKKSSEDNNEAEDKEVVENDDELENRNKKPTGEDEKRNTEENVIINKESNCQYRENAEYAAREDTPRQSNPTSLSEEIEKQKNNIRQKCFIIYGNCMTLYISVENLDGNEIAVARKIVVGKTKAPPTMLLGYGEISFVEKSSYVSSKVTAFLSESSEYLDTWNEYAELEGKMLLQRVREVGIIKFHENITVDNRGNYVIIPKEQDAIKLLNVGDSLVFTDTIPLYLENIDMTWESCMDDLSVFPNSKHDKNTLEAEIVEKDEKTVSVITKNRKEPPSSSFLLLNVNSDVTQIKRREDARRDILNGQCKMPTLGLVLDGRETETDFSSFAISKRISRIPTLSPFVKQKIFKHDPTDTQMAAIDLALNTPDIAVIQGPPGTGKTTVITAVIERLNELFDKRESIRGQVLITSFQHDAVFNVIERMTINSLPTAKFGKKSKSDEDEANLEEKIIENWCSNATRRIREKNELLNILEEQNDLSRIYSIYLMTPNNANALAFLNKAKSFTLSSELIEEIDDILETLRSDAILEYSNILQLVRRIRVTREGFLDDGSETALALYDEIEDKLGGGDRNEILTVLKMAALVTDIPTKEQLSGLKIIRSRLLERLIPAPFYKVDKPQKNIVNLYQKIVEIFKSPKSAANVVIFEFLSELENNPKSVRDSLADYSFVFSASTQQSVGADMRKAKQIGKEEKIDFDTVIVDEAARANPGDLMIPLTLAKRRIVLVGDHRQLPHIYNDEIVERMEEKDENFNIENIKTSMFQRLMESANKLEKGDGIPRTITLDAQYRTHPTLGEFVSRNFYEIHGEGYKSPLGKENFHQDLFPCPAVWIDVPYGEGPCMRDGTSYRRDAEIKTIVSRIENMLESEEGKGLSYGVITFYSAQVSAIKRRLGDNLNQKVRVGSVDAFQGMEFDVIFLSAVRTEKSIPDFTKEEIKNDKIGRRYYGFMVHPNRLCVAMSRQKKLLIIVGDGKMFNNDIAEEHVPAMKKFYELCANSNEGVLQDAQPA